ncbi:MAG: hypothetical protein ACAH17_00460 [Candidatus Paceibacterota bacterium]
MATLDRSPERLEGETDADYADRMKAQAEEARDTSGAWWKYFLVATALAVVLLVALCIVGYKLYEASDRANISFMEVGRLTGENTRLQKELDKKPAPTPTPAPTPAQMCPAAGNVILSIEEYDKLKARPKTCEKAKVATKKPRHDVIITERREVAPKSAPPVALSAPKACRWLSDGTLRLKEATSLQAANPLKELPRGTVIEIILKTDLPAGETCLTWQQRLEAKKADQTPRNRADFKS